MEAQVGAWPTFDRDEVMAAALLDRLLHRCRIVNIRGNSYRMRRHAELSKAIHPLASHIDAEAPASGEARHDDCALGSAAAPPEGAEQPQNRDIFDADNRDIFRAD